MLVADLTHDLFHQVFNRDQPGDSAVLIYDNRHPDILLLHLAEQITSELALRYEINVTPHQAVQRPDPRLTIRHLQHVLRVNDSLNIVDVPFIHGDAGVVFGP